MLFRSTLTAYIIGGISIIISNIIPHIINVRDISKYYYKLNPLYINRNIYKINLNCIIDAKLVHIIYAIYLIRKGDDINERTSNRKSYEYSYE